VTLASILLLRGSALASVTMNIDAADLRTADGQPVPLGGQILLVASANDAVIGDPTPASFVSGDDVILFRGSLDSGLPGYFQGSANFSFGSFPGIGAGDPVQLFWFPTLTSASVVPGAGTTYGTYRHGIGLDGSAPWVIPGDGAVVSLTFITESQGGSNPNVLGYASHTVAQQPVILSLTGAGTTNTVISWSAVSNVTYRVQYQNILAGNWTSLAPDVTADGSTASMVDSTTNVPTRFYRILLP
jgi:hypothetical protein